MNGTGSSHLLLLAVGLLLTWPGRPAAEEPLPTGAAFSCKELLAAYTALAKEKVDLERCPKESDSPFLAELPTSSPISGQPCRLEPVARDWHSGNPQALVCAYGPSGSGRYWAIDLQVGKGGQRPVLCGEAKTSTVGYRRFGDYPGGKPPFVPLIWLNDLNGNGTAELILWDSLPLRPEASNASFALVPRTLTFDGHAFRAPRKPEKRPLVQVALAHRQVARGHPAAGDHAAADALLTFASSGSCSRPTKETARASLRSMAEWARIETLEVDEALTVSGTGWFVRVRDFAAVAETHFVFDRFHAERTDDDTVELHLEAKAHLRDRAPSKQGYPIGPTLEALVTALTQDASPPEQDWYQRLGWKTDWQPDKVWLDEVEWNGSDEEGNGRRFSVKGHAPSRADAKELAKRLDSLGPATDWRVDIKKSSPRSGPRRAVYFRLTGTFEPGSGKKGGLP